LLEDELLLRQEVVGELGVEHPDLVELGPLRAGVVAVVADQLADPGPVLLLHVRAVVLVDELAGVVRVDAQDRERERGDDVLEGGEHPPLRLVGHGPVDRPSGRDIGDGQGETELSTAA